MYNLQKNLHYLQFILFELYDEKNVHCYLIRDLCLLFTHKLTIYLYIVYEIGVSVIFSQTIVCKINILYIVLSYLCHFNLF